MERTDIATEIGATSKITEWEKEPSVMDLKADLEAAKPAHDIHVARVKRWDELRNVTGKSKPPKIKGRSSVQPKLVRRQAEWRYSALSEPFLSSETMFDTEPTTFEDNFAAHQNKLVLNWQFRTKLNKVKLIDDYVRTAVDEGSVIVRLGWNRETVMVDTNVPIYQHRELQSQEEQDTLKQARQLKEENPNGYLDIPAELQAAVDFMEESGIETVAMQSGSEVVQEEEIIKNEPTVTVMNPANVVFDPSCEGNIENAGFAVATIETSKAELKKDGRYKNLDQVIWGNASVLAEPDHGTNTPNDFNFKDDLRKRIVAHEYWGWYDVNGDDTLVPIVATWIGEVMIRMEENPFPDQKLPFILATYMPMKRDLYGEPDAELLEDNQKIVGALMRGAVDLMGRSANSQQGMAKGFLDVTNRRRYDDGRDYEFNPGNGDPRMSVYQHQYPELPNSALTMTQVQNQEAEALTGVKSFSGGLSGDAYGDVAKGIGGMMDAAALREMNILRRLAKGMIDIGRKIASMNAVFLSEEETVRVTNKKFVQVRREDLKGQFDLILDISTPEVDERKAQDMGFMLQTMGPNMDPAMSQLILADIAELKRMPTLAESIRTYEPKPDPFTEKMKELEMAKLEAEIAKIESETQENMADAQKKSSEADLKDLEYVENETGTSHARDLDRAGSQARANQDLEVTKSLLKAKKPEEREPDVAAAVGYNEIVDQSSGARTGGMMNPQNPNRY
jgi:hypothetical protein